MPAQNSMRYIFSLIWFVSLDRHWHMFFMNGTLFFFLLSPRVFFHLRYIHLSLFLPRTAPHASYFALNRRDASAIVMHGVQVSRAIRVADHVDVGDVSPSTFRVRFFYNPARWQWRQRLPNDPSFLSRGFSVFLPRGKPRITRNGD